MRYKEIIDSFMWTVYVLESLKDGWRYTGMTGDIKRRLREHNAGKMRSTKSHLPYVIIYREILKDSQSARLREKYLKTAAGRRYIEKLNGNRGSPPA